MCDTLVALADETEEGATLFAKNSDRERNEAQALLYAPRVLHAAGASLQATYISIPQARETYACLLSRPFWMWGAEMGANEHGIVIGNEAMHARTPAQRKRALTGMDLVRLGLERGASAAEAVEVMIALLEQHGQGGDCGHLHRFYYNNGFLIADAREAYVLETIGRDWIVERVTHTRALSNAFSIGANYASASEALSARAREENWSVQDGRFDFAANVVDEEKDAGTFGRGRCARGGALLARTRPSLRGMMAILRDHGPEGERAEWTPADTARRSICMHAAEGPRRSQTVGSMVSHIRADGAVHWMTASAAPCLSIFKPVVLDAPMPFAAEAPTDVADASTRWWRHERFHRAVNTRFAEALLEIAAERDALEAAFIDRMAAASPQTRGDVALLCWREADEMEARWAARWPEIAAPKNAHQRSWTRLNRLAGLA